LLGPHSLARRELAGDDRGGKQDAERQPLRRIRDRELVAWVDEEPVIGEERTERCRDGRATSEAGGQGQHDDEIEHRDVRDRSHAQDKTDQRGHDGDTDQGDAIAPEDFHRAIGH
jgi:hypothetical protein